MPSLSTIIALTVCFAVFLALTRRPWTSFALTLYLVGFVLLSSWQKLVHLGLALTLADVHFFLLRPENFRLFSQYPLLGVLLVAVIAGAAACVWLGLRHERPWRFFDGPRSSGWLRVATGSVAVAGAVLASWLAAPPSQARVDNGTSYAAFLVMYESQHPKGVIGLLNLFFNNRSFEADLPPPRKQERFVAGDSPTAADVKAPSPPDIMLVLEESTFDPRLIRKCPPQYCDNDILHAPRAATRTEEGPLLVHTTGGGTWLSEFALLTGFDWRVFGRGGGFAPVSLAPRVQNALPRYLRTLGYRTIAIYPTAGNFLSARKAYEQYGFDEFYDVVDLQLPSEWEDTFDRMVFDKALSIAARGDDRRPIFMFVLTIRNHGPHGWGKIPIPPTFAPASKALNDEMADYLARMRGSSEDFSALSNSWLKSERPRVLVWFGDHQPEAAWDYTQHPETLDEKRVAGNLSSHDQLSYVTRYQLSANFGARSQKEERNALDLSFLGAQLLEFAGLPLDAGNKAAREVELRCGGLMFECADRQLIADYLDFRIHDLKSLR